MCPQILSPVNKQNSYIEIEVRNIKKIKNRESMGIDKPVKLTMRALCTLAGLHTSDKFILEAVREVKVVGVQFNTRWRTYFLIQKITKPFRINGKL